MRFEDNMMPILTGLVFAVVLGTTVQNSDDILSVFSADAKIQADDDVFFVRAGSTSTLDVLANDYTGSELSGSHIQILSGPNCGDVAPTVNGITYLNSGSCEGPVSFTYCLGDGQTCDAADVTMNVRPAPVAIAETNTPQQGDLIPLPLSHSSNSNAKRKTKSAIDQKTQLSAFVVTIAPQALEAAKNTPSIEKYTLNANVADLNKVPSSDPAQFATLRSMNVPLSALRTAQFLTSYDDLVVPAVANNEQIETNAAKSSGPKIEDETATIDLKEPVFLSTQG